MNLFSYVVVNIRRRWLASGLCVVSVTCAVALMVFTLASMQSLQSGFRRNSGDVHLVAGTAGSKLQLVLSSLYHMDVPNGNMPADVAAQIAQQPGVTKAVPVTIGDSYRGMRLVGTTPDYLELYKAQLADGAADFMAEDKVVAGAATRMKVGDSFQATHGLSPFSDDVHAEKFIVTGVLQPTGTVIDKLLLTSIASIQHMHAHPDADEEAEEHAHHDHAHEGHEGDEEHEEHAPQVTALLIKVGAPAGVMNLPRVVQARFPGVVVASPAYEVARLAGMIGLSRDAVLGLSAMMAALAAFMILGILSAGMNQRLYDLAVLRVMGVSRAGLLAVTLGEGALLGGVGAAIGVFAGQALAQCVFASIPSLAQFGATPALDVQVALQFVGGGGLLGAVAALLPAFKALDARLADRLNTRDA